MSHQLKVLCCSILGVMLTWFLNHEMGYGPIIANGLVGLVAATVLPSNLAGVTYTASFVGMSGTQVLASLSSSLLGGLVVGLVILLTPEIYAGIGGKGGTTAALSAQISRMMAALFGI